MVRISNACPTFPAVSENVTWKRPADRGKSSAGDVTRRSPTGVNPAAPWDVSEHLQRHSVVCVRGIQSPQSKLPRPHPQPSGNAWHEGDTGQGKGLEWCWGRMHCLTCPLLPASGSRARTTATLLPTVLSSGTLTDESEVMSNCGLLSFSSRTVMVTCGHGRSEIPVRPPESPQSLHLHPPKVPAKHVGSCPHGGHGGMHTDTAG